MLDLSLFKDFDAATAVRHGLPGAAYTSAEFLRLEYDTLFTENWIFAGFVHDFVNPGDLRPIEVAGLPLFLLRDPNGDIAAFHNVCRHRSLKLVDAAGNCGKPIRCPYHSWSYDLCGALKNAPYFGGGMRELPPGFESGDHGLIPVACRSWHDWIFVCLAPEPMPFDEFLLPIEKMLGDTRVEEYLPVSSIDFGEIDCNWKLLMENFIEPYHVQFVHRTTTAQPLEDHYTLVEGHCVGSAVDIDAEREAKADLTALGVTSHYLTLFPSFILGTYQPDQMGVYLHQPVDAGRTRQRRVIYTHRDANYSVQQIQQLTELWHSVHLEDHAMCRRMQLGRVSPLAADGGILSPRWENSVRRFQEMIADAVRPLLNEQRKP